MVVIVAIKKDRRVREIDQFVPVTKAKNNLLEIIRQVEKEESTIAVTKNGVPTVVILSMEKFTGLLETLELLTDEETMKSLRRSMRQARQGKWVREEEVFGR
jgi:antitoxin YefM